MNIDEVREVVSTLRAAGEKVTYDAVRDALGGGSRRDIALHMQELKAAGDLPDPPLAESVPDAVPVPERRSLVEAALANLARLEDQRDTARVRESQLLLDEMRLRKHLAQALVAGHDSQTAMLNQEIATLRAELARVQTLLETLPEALTLAQQRLVDAQQRQQTHEVEHWLRVQRTLADPAQRWVAGLLAGQRSRWSFEDVRQPVAETRVQIAAELKETFPVPILLEDEA